MLFRILGHTHIIVISRTNNQEAFIKATNFIKLNKVIIRKCLEGTKEKG